MKRSILLVLSLSLLLSAGCGGQPEEASPQGMISEAVREEILAEAPDYLTEEELKDTQEVLPERPAHAGSEQESLPEAEKQTLILATVVDAINVAPLVSAFNRSSERYRVAVRDYSNSGEYDVSAAILRLNTDLGSGKAPDLLLISWGLSPFPYISHGYLEDLSPFFQEDDDLDPEDLSVYDPLFVDGGLYFLGSGFVVESLCADRALFGERWGWTLEEYFEIEQTRSASHMLYNVTSASLLRQLSARFLKTAIDWREGTCSFDQEAFVKILESCKRAEEYPEPTDPSQMIFGYPTALVASAQLLAACTYGSGVDRFALDKQMAQGMGLAYIGWPTVDGSCGSDVELIQPFSMFSASKCREGCWAFLRYVLQESELFGPQMTIPLYRPALEEQIAQAREDASVTDVGVFEGLVLDEEAESAFRGLLEHITDLAMYDETVLTIIDEEGAVFFAGDCTAENAAQNIQARVSLYLAEQT